jgi:hypothetical protein
MMILTPVNAPKEESFTVFRPVRKVPGRARRRKVVPLLAQVITAGATPASSVNTADDSSNNHVLECYFALARSKMTNAELALETITSADLSPTEHLILKHFIESAVDPEAAAQYLLGRTWDTTDSVGNSLRNFKRQWRRLASRCMICP